jgi:hypothetical protein
MRLKFTYIEDAPANGHLQLQEDVSQFFRSVKSRSKTTAEEGDALQERSLPTLALYAYKAELTSEQASKFISSRNAPGELVKVPVCQVIHNTLHEYEQRYMRSALGGKPGGPKNAFDILMQEFEARFAYLKKIAIGPLDPPIPNAYGITVREGAIPLGQLFVANSRFVELDNQEPGLRATVFVDREKPGGKQYIQLPDDTFTKRYVMRGLSGYDGMRLTTHQPLLSTFDSALRDQSETSAGRHGPGAAPLTATEQVISHTRGWKKRFISTGASKRDVYSTRGTQFQSLFGSAVIDLARLTVQPNIVDVHRADVATAHLGDPDELVTHGTDRDELGVTELEKQKYLGLRDVVRTRELLISGLIDYAAVRTHAAGRSLVGLGAKTRRDETDLGNWLEDNRRYLAPSIISHEVHNYRDAHTDRIWTFIAFQNPVLAQILRITKRPPNEPAGTRLPDTIQIVLFDVFRADLPAQGW